MSSYQQCINQLFLQKRSLKQTAIQSQSLMLRMKTILNLKTDNCIHIGGTNGKGSVSLKVANALENTQNMKVGLFTSPHLVCYRERIQINQTKIEEQEVIEYYEQISRQASQHNINLSFFQMTTLMGLLYFHHQQTDMNVIEVGLGGQYDCTNIIDNPILSVITNVSIDHQQQLGHTLTDITNNKVGIIKQNSIMVCGIQQEQYNQIVRTRCEQMQTQYYQTHTNQHDDFRLQNNTLVIKILQVLEQHNYIQNIQQSDLQKYVLSIEQPFRLQQIDRHRVNRLFNHFSIEYKNINVFVDVGHNESGIQQSISLLQKQIGHTSKFRLIIGCSHDKNIQNISQFIKQTTSHVYLVRTKNQRAMDPIRLGQMLDIDHIQQQYGFCSEQVMNQCLQEIEEGETILIQGSFYLVCEIQSIFDN